MFILATFYSSPGSSCTERNQYYDKYTAIGNSTDPAIIPTCVSGYCWNLLYKDILASAICLKPWGAGEARSPTELKPRKVRYVRLHSFSAPLFPPPKNGDIALEKEVLYQDSGCVFVKRLLPDVTLCYLLKWQNHHFRKPQQKIITIVFNAKSTDGKHFFVFVQTKQQYYLHEPTKPIVF